MTEPAETPSTPVHRRNGASKFWSAVKIAGAGVVIAAFALMYAGILWLNAKDGGRPYAEEFGLRVGLHAAKWFAQKTLPQQVDDSNIWTGIRVEGRTLIYEMQVERVPGFLTAAARNVVCNEKDLVKALEMGANLQIEYYAKSGEFLSSVFVSSRDCLI